MNSLAVLLVCVQAFLVQNVFSQCLGAYAPGAYAPGLPPGSGYSSYQTCGYDSGYGGAGEGNVAVAGELPVAGTTSVAGQIPIMGAVRFGGEVPAAGVVIITGQCACGCGGPNRY